MSDHYPLYIALRGLMVRAAPAMQIGKDALGEFTLNVPREIMNSKDPIWFGSVRLTGNNVSYYLPPLAAREGRDLVVPEALKRLSTSKTCFVFHDQNPDRFAELEDVTRAAADKFTSATRAA
ncbi:hypothetical protein ABI_14600 [Asticcacaulis biprosthecium C19]|uniref:YdhG-like domain-containing protein n=1 Tax=Asticcacaulis biprosthecium C19 TaxID=715226 RepID=F4QIV8_9CAUL|nr:hypothetical protein [Asticcacaulis biprosthecium]EGF93021.1 hypothetical protein ABI_14600 [Asticcacaulis biprosthecium C19]